MMQDNTAAQGQDTFTDDQELDTIEQVEVPFLNEMILALLGSDNEIYVPVIPFSQRLGIGNPYNQIARVKRDEALLSGLRDMVIGTAGGPQKTKCLRLDTFALWLATISENMCRAEIRPILKHYKLEAANAIVEHFKLKASALRARLLVPKLQLAITERPPMPAPGSSPDEWRAWHLAMADVYLALKEQGAMLGNHEHRLNKLDAEVEALSENMVGVKEVLAMMGEVPAPRIGIHQANQIQALVSKIHEATHIHQATIFAAFKKHWRLPRYDELPLEQFDEAYAWLRQWGRARLPT